MHDRHPQVDRHPLTVDANGFVIGTDRPGPYGQRPTLGGLGATVARGHQVALIVGLDDVPVTHGLLLHLVWIPGANPNYPVTEADRAAVMHAYERGDLPVEQVPAEGLVALDAWIPPVETP